MKIDITIQKADAYDLVHVQALMRKADREEIWASHHWTAEDAIKHIAEQDPMSARVNGCPMCVFGVEKGSLLSDTGAPWMLGTDKIFEHRFGFAKKSRQGVDLLKRGLSYLENFVDARNTLAVGWLRWLGFEIHDPKPYGIEKMPFHRFSMEL